MREALRKRYVVVETYENRVSSDVFRVWWLPLMRACVNRSNQIVNTIPDWPYVYEVRELRQER